VSDNGEEQPTDTPGSGDQPQEGTGVQHEDKPDDLRPESAPPAPEPEGS
jgi:hypothetical protein